jgi:hypothetical protein
MAGSVPSACADAKTAAAREFAEWVLRKFGGKAIGEGVETFSKKILTLSSRYGDDVVRTAVQKVGPKALTFADDAAAHAPQVLRFLGKYGDEGAAVLTRSSTKFLSLGDDAARALVTHKGVAEPLLERFGAAGARTLAAVTPRSGRRLAMLNSTLLSGPQAEKVMGVIARYGDRAATFVWDHKGALAVGAGLTAFLADPEPFIDGSKQIAEVIAEKGVVPVATVVVSGGVKMIDSVASSTVAPLATAASKAIPWGTLASVSLVLAGTVAALGVWRLRTKVRTSVQ